MFVASATPTAYRLTGDGKAALGRHRLESKGKASGAPGGINQKATDGDTPSTAGMKWQEAAQRLEELRKQGERYTSCAKLGQRLRCSPSTIQRAIKSSPKLRAWAQRPPTKPRAVGQPRPQGEGEDAEGGAVFNRTAQSRELDPEDALAIKEYRKQLSPDDRVWFDSLSTEDQITVVNDPDAGDRTYPRV
jgi:hypothetical protein